MTPTKRAARGRRGLRVVLAAVCAALALATAPAGAASAAANAATPAAVSVGTGFKAESPKSPQNTIVCSFILSIPDSTSVPGQVSGLAEIDCTAPVASISILFNLYRDGTLVATRFNEIAGNSFLVAGNSTPCVNGTYTDQATAEVVFPPGYVPPEADGELDSPAVSITC
jgi:hypothetical protein